MYKTCHECGELIISRDDMGTETDGQLNQHYCRRCLRDGRFQSSGLYDSGPEPYLAYGIPATLNMGWGLNPGMTGWIGAGYPAPLYPGERME